MIILILDFERRTFALAFTRFTRRTGISRRFLNAESHHQ